MSTQDNHDEDLGSGEYQPSPFNTPLRPRQQLQRVARQTKTLRQHTATSASDVASSAGEWQEMEEANVTKLAVPTELPASLPDGCIVPTVKNTFNHALQRKMLHLLGIYNSGRVLTSVIRNAEETTAPNVVASSLIHHPKALDIGQTMLINSLPRRRVKVLLENTYVPTAIELQWHAKESDVGPSFNDRAERQVNKEVADPGIYMNCVSPRSGLPLSRTQFKHLIGAIRLLSGQMSLAEKTELAPLFRDAAGVEINARVQRVWRELHIRMGQRVEAFSEDEATSQVEQEPHSLPMYVGEQAGDEDEEEDDEEEEDEEDEEDEEGEGDEDDGQVELEGRVIATFKPYTVNRPTRRNMIEWASVWTSLIDATPHHIIYFPLPTEIGYSIDLYDRMRQHRQLRGKTARLMQVVFLTAMALFPELDFVMYQFVLFRLFEAEDASLAECLATTMNMAYLKTGGFNTVQAGVQVSSADMTNEKIRRRWEKVQDRAKQLEIVDIVRQNQATEAEEPTELLEKLRQQTAEVEKLEAERKEYKEWLARPEAERETAHAEELLKKYTAIVEAEEKSAASGK